MSLQLGLDDTLRLLRPRPDLRDPQPGLIQHVPPLALGALFGAHHAQHGEIALGAEDIGAMVRDDKFVEDDLGVARCHGRGDVLEDGDALREGPVVEDVS